MKCPNCGAELALDPASGMLTCDYCDTAIDPATLTEEEKPAAPAEDPDASVQNADKKKKKPKQESAQEVAPDGDVYTATVYTCRSCGAELLVTDETAVTFCSYCGSQQVLRSRVESMRKPSFIIPFTQTKEDCEAAYRKVMRASGFAPSEMTKDTTVEKFRGIYMPYWVYDLDAKGDIRTFGKQTTRRGDWILTRHFRVESRGYASYKGISFDASSSFSDNLSQCIAPYDLRGSRNFDEVYLSGYYEDMADVDVSVYRSDAERVATAHVADTVSKDPMFAGYGIGGEQVQNAVPMSVTSEKMGLFPVWFLGVRSRDGQRISYAVVNGQTGKVAADLPMSYSKYLLTSLVMAVPIFLLLNLFLTLTPTKALFGAILLAFISLLISNGQLNDIYTRENQLDDKGVRFSESTRGMSRSADQPASESVGFLQTLKDVGFGKWWKGAIFVAYVALRMGSDLLFSSFGMILVAIVSLILVASFVVDRSVTTVKKERTKSYKMPFGQKQAHLFLQELAIIIAVLVEIADPPGDIWYYGAAAISMVCIVLAFLDLVRGHNRLTTRKLPQMAARGGDEYELE